MTGTVRWMRAPEQPARRCCSWSSTASSAGSFEPQLLALENRLYELQLAMRPDAAMHTLTQYDSVRAKRQGQLINVLTIIATILLPPTFSTGFFGTNFEAMTNDVGSGSTFIRLGLLLPTGQRDPLTSNVPQAVAALRGRRNAEATNRCGAHRQRGPRDRSVTSYRLVAQPRPGATVPAQAASSYRRRSLPRASWLPLAARE